MTMPQFLIFGILAATVALFMWGRLRHDLVALCALLACVIAGLVSAPDAFAGFGHPAVITVACILILSHGLQNTGGVDWLVRNVLPRDAGRAASMAALIGLGAAMSGFMNNVGAMALLMPVAVHLSGRLNMTAGQVLMPLAFGTILGGMTTLVGTPPNLIVSGYRAQAGQGAFGMFDFAPVGVAVAVLGVAFVALVGWRLVPARKAAGAGRFETDPYVSEVRVPEKSKAAGMTLRAFENAIDDGSAQVTGLVRNDVRLNAPHPHRHIHAGDMLVLEADVGTLTKALGAFGMVLEEQGDADSKTRPPHDDPATKKEKDATRDADIVTREVAVLPGSHIVGRSASNLHLRARYGLNLLAVSRGHTPQQKRLRDVALQSGDLVLLQGPADAMAGFIHDAGCVPLGERDLRIPDKRKAVLAAAILLGAVVLVTLGVLSAAIAFMSAVVVSMLVRTVPPRQVYTAIDWPVIVLLGALIPVAGAMQVTGAADVLAVFLVQTIAQENAVASLAVVLAITMFLSDLMNNAATAAVLSPVALGIAGALGVNPDSFLMAVAIGASCAFLTPIGHQNNTLILGPGGFRFGDYWRLGLPLEVLVVAVSIPMLLWVWPL
ncbi:SLC13 family permease [Roseinatronobacter sp. S2]|uniref:SLC13 family permease n=1 Tax=Roseinatronobacter sp. S2 TaxID=3035471 RepID=UPI00240FB436|nr:SLC13 family permease [Roseinatronobacter sp. S2]WFE73670.1 SLC13 family permease [Roseinatronobacter sp. S2]